MKKYIHPSPFLLESGRQIEKLEIAYEIIGSYRPGVSKIVWVCHALTANADVSSWWAGLFGSESLFDRKEYVVICANILGSCYGTTGPLSKSEGNESYFLDFPLVTTRDMAQAHEILRVALGIEEIYLLIGSSLGGQQAQEFAMILKDQLKQLVLIATNARHSAFGIAFNEAQRLAIAADPSFWESKEEGGQNGLIAARSIAMLSYRSYEGYQLTQSELDSSKLDEFRASSYQRYQGEKLAKRFNAYSYWFLSKAMDAHNVGRNRESIEKALQEINAKTLVVAISSDQLFPVHEQKYLAQHISNAEFYCIDSIYGHDGFLVETQILGEILSDFLNNNFNTYKQTTFKSGVNRIQFLN